MNNVLSEATKFMSPNFSKLYISFDFLDFKSETLRQPKFYLPNELN